MSEKFNILYEFMNETLGLKEKEALQNTLKLESGISEENLKRLKTFLRFSLYKLSTDPLYLEEFKQFTYKIKHSNQ